MLFLFKTLVEIVFCSLKHELFLQQLYRKRPGMSMSCARLPQNVSKNRYRDISPCEYTQLVFVLDSEMFSWLAERSYRFILWQMTPLELCWRGLTIISMQISLMWAFIIDYGYLSYFVNVLFLDNCHLYIFVFSDGNPR